MEEKIYEISFQVSKDLYPKEVLLMTAYLFLNKAYIHIDSQEMYWLIQMKAKECNIKTLQNEFENELLNQSVRSLIYRKTHSIRELLLARAMSSSMITSDDFTRNIEMDQNSHLQEDEKSILQDWFEKNEK